MNVRAIAAVTLVFVLALATAAYVYVANVQAQAQYADRCLYHHCPALMWPAPQSTPDALPKAS
jgi:hypothetical protein